MINHVRSAAKVQLDAELAGPLFMLAAALLYTLLNVFVKLNRLKANQEGSRSRDSHQSRP